MVTAKLNDYSRVVVVVVHRDEYDRGRRRETEVDRRLASVNAGPTGRHEQEGTRAKPGLKVGEGGRARRPRMRET
jgi:hypothetical protein